MTRAYPGPGMAIQRVPVAVIMCAICQRQIERPTAGQVRAKAPCCGRIGCSDELRRRQARRAKA